MNSDRTNTMMQSFVSRRLGFCVLDVDADGAKVGMFIRRLTGSDLQIVQRRRLAHHIDTFVEPSSC